MFKKLIFGLLAVFSIGVGQLIQADDYNAPRPKYGVYDPNHYLSNETLNLVKETNATFAKTEAKPQIGVYVVKKLTYGVEDTANHIARLWKVGYDTNNGVLILVSIEDRKFRIETSDNIAANYLTDSQAYDILHDNTLIEYMQNSEYDTGIRQIIQNVATAITPKSDEELAAIKKQKEKEFEDAKHILTAIVIIILGILATIASRSGISHYMKYKKEKKRIQDLTKRSQYDYQELDKLTPLDPHFIDNPSWSVDKKRQFWTNTYLVWSQFDYYGLHKLYPNDRNFIPNASWTPQLLQAHYDAEAEKERKRLEQKRLHRKNCLKRSQYDYQGIDKLYPNDSEFITNATWTTLLLNQFNEQQRRLKFEEKEKRRHRNSYDSDNSSSSGWSSDSWDGGGFSGGGASGGW